MGIRELLSFAITILSFVYDLLRPVIRMVLQWVAKTPSWWPTSAPSPLAHPTWPPDGLAKVLALISADGTAGIELNDAGRKLMDEFLSELERQENQEAAEHKQFLRKLRRQERVLREKNRSLQQRLDIVDALREFSNLPAEGQPMPSHNGENFAIEASLT